MNIFAALKQYATKFELTNTRDFDEEEVKKYDVKDVLPVMIVTDNNIEVSRLIGEKSYEEIIEFLKGNDLL